MLQRSILLLTVAAMVALALVVTASPAFAARGGEPGPNPEASKGISISQCASAFRSNAVECKPV
jgi:hypothetical protein